MRYSRKLGRIRNAYFQHKLGAEKRGISFEFTLDEWVEWWESHLGEDWIWMRGSFKNQYVMARLKDEGPYKASNVVCIRQWENASQAARRRTSSR